MKIPSVYNILFSALCLFMVYNFWSFVEFITSSLKCSEEPCLESYLNSNPNLRMEIFTTFSPFASIVSPLDRIRNFDYRKEFKKDYNITLPMQTRYNGTLWMFVLVGEDDLSEQWNMFNAETSSEVFKLPLGEYAIPGLGACEPLRAEDDDPQETWDGEKKELKPVSHLYKNVYVTLLTERFSLNQKDVPFEMKQYIKINYNNEIRPILESDFFKTRYSDLVEVTENMTTFQLTLHYNPISVLRHRFIMIFRANALIDGYEGLSLDEIKKILTTKSVYMLCLALANLEILVILYILTYRNDILFWKTRKSYVGLSERATLLRCFGLIIIFLFLRDEDAPLIALVVSSLVAAIELWKCKKILKIEFTLRGIRRRRDEQSPEVAKAEKETQEFDKQAMRYLSYVLIPLFLGGIAYYLTYPPYRSWYSWTLASLAKGLHAFGWLFMFPQVFINYKMKSVAALPWLPFFYRALTTFFGDVNTIIFSGQIYFNTSCFREDVVFLIFLYQRWLYRVHKDKTLIESSLIEDDETEVDSDIQEAEVEVREKKDN